MTNNLTDVLLGPPQLAEPLDWLNRRDCGLSLRARTIPIPRAWMPTFRPP